MPTIGLWTLITHGSEIREHARFIRKCEDVLFRNLRGFASKAAERFLSSVHKQMVKYPERYPTEKQAAVIDQIYNEALDELAREGRYAFYMLPLKHKGREFGHEADVLRRPEEMERSLRVIGNGTS